jgi:light-regulated signal transduction histidine kinase (bacteriophytochrome)
MKDTFNDITDTIISVSDIRQRLGSIFPDSVILDTHFKILSVSENILEATGHTLQELKGKSLSSFSKSKGLQRIIKHKLKGGFFEEQPFRIRCKTNEWIHFKISGFYLGLIAGEINDVIVLRFKNIEEVIRMHDKLNEKIRDFDNFVYQSAHALRGPLATIKGLINLAKTASTIDELKFLNSQMEVFSERLDDKLHRLICFTESDQEFEPMETHLSLQSICSALKEDVREASIDFPVNFEYSANIPMLLKKGEVFLSLLRNLVLFLCQQPKEIGNALALDVHTKPAVVELVIRAKGFALTESLREKLMNANFGYYEILYCPELTNCYAAKKIIFKLKGDIQFILSDLETTILITVPMTADNFS